MPYPPSNLDIQQKRCFYIRTVPVLTDNLSEIVHDGTEKNEMLIFQWLMNIQSHETR